MTEDFISEQNSDAEQPKRGRPAKKGSPIIEEGGLALKAQQPSSKIVEKKKGSPVSWKPGNALDAITGHIPGYGLRWVNAGSEKVSKRMAEGYEPVTAEEAPSLAKRFMNGRKDIKSDDGIRCNDLILMKMPEEIMDARKEYMDHQKWKQRKLSRAAQTNKAKYNMGGIKITGSVQSNSSGGDVEIIN